MGVVSSNVWETVDFILLIAQCLFVGEEPGVATVPATLVISIVEYRLATSCSDVELGQAVFEEGLNLNHEKHICVLTLPSLLSRGRTAA